MATQAELLYVKTNVGGFFFDAFLNLNHTTKTTITSHPVMTGANISDHAYQEPRELTIEIGMSDCMIDIVDGQFAGGWSRSVTAYNILQELQATRVPLQIVTRLGVYNNMLIESIVAPDDNKTLYGLRATVTFKEVLVVNVQTVKLSLDAQKTDTTDRGNITPEPDDNSGGSVLSQSINSGNGVEKTSYNQAQGTLIGSFNITTYGLDSTQPSNQKILNSQAIPVGANTKWPIGLFIVIDGLGKALVTSNPKDINANSMIIYYDNKNPSVVKENQEFGTKTLNVYKADGGVG